MAAVFHIVVSLFQWGFFSFHSKQNKTSSKRNFRLKSNQPTNFQQTARIWHPVTSSSCRNRRLHGWWNTLVAFCGSFIQGSITKDRASSSKPWWLPNQMEIPRGSRQRWMLHKFWSGRTRIKSGDLLLEWCFLGEGNESKSNLVTCHSWDSFIQTQACKTNSSSLLTLKELAFGDKAFHGLFNCKG